MNDSPRSGSPATRALWVIAFSMLLIAGCLIILVSRQMFQPRERVPAPVQESPRSETPTKHAATVPPLLRMPQLNRSTNRAASHPEVAAAEPAPPPVPMLNEPPAVPAGQSPQWQASGGLAPLTGLVQTNQTGTIRGRVTLKGTPPPEVVFTPDSLCGKLPSTPKTTHLYVISTNGGWANVFVYIRSGLEGKKFPVPSQPAVLDQVNCEFEPAVLGLMVNQELLIRNSDPVRHNVHAFTQDKNNQAFNLMQDPGSTIEKNFAAAEIPLAVRCDMHPWMFAWIGVTDHPFFAVTDRDGNYSITNVPPGDYVVEARRVMNRISELARIKDAKPTQSVTVRPGETMTADFVVTAPGSQMSGVRAQGR